MNKHLLHIIGLAIMGYGLSASAKPHAKSDALTDTVMHRIFCYAQQVDTTGRGSKSSYAYTKFQMRTNKRNVTLMLVPTMYAVSHGAGRSFLCENYNRIEVNENGEPIISRLLSLSTIPRKRNTMTSVLKYMTPNVYGEKLFQENILSPFHISNRRYYKYSVIPLPYGKAQVYAYPRIKNTQLVETRAIVQVKSGQIYLCDFEGEYDMTRFYISVTMGREGFKTLGPIKCDMRANFKFMGNKITGKYTTIYDLPKVLGDSLSNLADTTLMAKVRPTPLNTNEEMIYREYFEKMEQHESMGDGKDERKEEEDKEKEGESKRKKRENGETKEKGSFVKDVLWNVVGDNLVNHISSDFGNQNQGYFRLDPLFNPLYMGYSHKKGIVYKFRLRSEYAFSDNQKISLGAKGGYSFKQHRFYINIPVKFDYNVKHEGNLLLQVGNGNRINTNRMARQVLNHNEFKHGIGNFSPSDIPAIISGKTDYTKFKDEYIRLTNHWRFTPKWAMELGLVSHNRSAVRPEFYELLGYPSKYKSVAPAIGIEWRPKEEKGMVLKFDYEQGVKKLFGGNIDYGRAEFDAQTILYASRRRSYSLRFGTGFYTMRTNHWDFVDYTNFHDNNIPGGWNDEWSGDFELLSSQWYNASNYYLRANFTYEAPIVLSAWLPLVGRFFEKERFYISGLAVKDLCPYTEWGYGLSTRLASLGFFAAFRNFRFDGIGCRFGFELFRHW